MKDCRAHRRALLLGQAAPGDHGAQCADCRRFGLAEEGTRELLQQHRPVWSASDALRERVRKTLETERARASRAPVRRRAVLGMLGLGAGAAAAATVTWWVGRTSAGAERARALVELLVDDHLEYARRGVERLQIASDSAEPVQAFFEAELGLATRLPVLHGATLLGARRCKLAGRPAALVFFETSAAPSRGVERVSLFVFEQAGEDWSAVADAPFLPGRRAVQEKRGVGLVVWQERGLTYVLAGAMEPAKLGALIGGE